MVLSGGKIAGTPVDLFAFVQKIAADLDVRRPRLAQLAHHEGRGLVLGDFFARFGDGITDGFEIVGLARHEFIEF